tara:strand:- start:673 stop:1092 length:420 start_codon:yes stop_codon:yes gene_type:complete
MNYSEFLFQLFCNLKALYQKNLNLPNISFQQTLAIASIDDDGLEMSSLSKTLGIDNSTGTRLIDGLEKKGLVIRVRDKIDNRIFKIFLTNRGKKIYSSIESELEKIGDGIENQINLKTKEELVELGISLNWAIIKRLNK